MERTYQNQFPKTRRDFLWKTGGGLGGVALAALLKDDSMLSANGITSQNPLANRPAPFPATANCVIEIFCPGGLSHVDTWDFKPELERQHGQAFDVELGKQTFAGIGGNYAKSFWTFRQHGACGKSRG
jgi:hypothetical protein